MSPVVGLEPAREEELELEHAARALTYLPPDPAHRGFVHVDQRALLEREGRRNAILVEELRCSRMMQFITLIMSAALLDRLDQ
jgi:hypothetical protein